MEPTESPVLSGGEPGEAINITLSYKVLIMSKHNMILFFMFCRFTFDPGDWCWYHPNQFGFKHC